jgi:FAS-associated death domain protein
MATVSTDRWFRSMLIDIGERIVKNELDTMKYYCRDFVPMGRLETIESAINLWEALEEKGKLGPRNIEFLRELVGKALNRVDLLGRIAEYDKLHLGGTNSIQTEVHQQDNCFIDPGLQQQVNFVAERVNIKKWRPLARTLRLLDSDIDCLSQQHPTDVREQIRRALLLWMCRFGDQATRVVLHEALKQCQMKLIADQLDVQFRTH